MCLQTYTNYPAIWISMKGSAIDTGVPSGIIRHNVTCAELGYKKQTHDLDDLPMVFRAVYAGVTSWKKEATNVAATKMFSFTANVGQRISSGDWKCLDDNKGGFGCCLMEDSTIKKCRGSFNSYQ